jgi:ribokinase
MDSSRPCATPDPSTGDRRYPSARAAPANGRSGCQNSIVVSPGENNSLTTTDVRSAAAQLGSADVVLLQLEIPMEAVAEAAALTRGNVVLNPAPAAQVPAAVLERVDILVPNRAELATLSGADRLESIRDVVAVARALRGPRAVWQPSAATARS